MNSLSSLKDGRFYPVSEQRPPSHSLRVLTQGRRFILIGCTAHCRGSCSATFVCPGQVNRVFLWHSWFVTVVFFLVVSPRHAFGLGAVSAFVAVFASILELSPTAFNAYVAVFAGIFAVTVAVFFASGYGLFGSSVLSQVTLPFSCSDYFEILTWSFENSPGPHEAEELHPTWPRRGSRVTGASDGLVRTRLCYFSVCSHCQVVCLPITPRWG